MRATTPRPNAAAWQSIEQEPRHFDALHLLGVLCLDRKQLADAVDYLTRAARERPDDAQVHYHLGTALLEPFAARPSGDGVAARIRTAAR